MKTTRVDQPVALACVFVWTGFICAVSFLEAWLKFRAPGVTLPIGLGIGRLVFNALNKIEWGFGVVILVSAFLHNRLRPAVPRYLLLTVLVILLLQTAWLLPQLDTRASLVISGQQLPHSYLHLYYIGAELLKTILIVRYGIKLFQPL
ncbi:hypothetical protein [uncultured Chitinophaga sp.]|jgi:hypothetical protein|uniref:hypothetical protein n=1 Tax=uncultured Chitinophaga sp. TaxID=339340 RepID=UPI002638F928|nr:hypothetical protein [uncultured Chitinophaga sp.]